MRAQTLALCLPFDTCNKKCPYCVSKMTWAPEIDGARWCRNLEMVKRFAERSQVTDIVITGKGEPALNIDFIRNHVIRHFGQWPLVLQTNGKEFLKDPERDIRRLCNVFEGNPFSNDQEDWGGVNVFAVSIDHPELMEKYGPIWKACKTMGVISRITVMLTPAVIRVKFMDWVELCKKYDIKQMSFREVTVPTGRVMTKDSNKTAIWIKDNIKGYMKIVSWLQDYNLQQGSDETYRKIRKLPYGAVIKDVEGIAVTFFNYCIQDENGEDDIRSLIYNQDGHLYTTWNSPASVIF